MSTNFVQLTYVNTQKYHSTFLLIKLIYNSGNMWQIDNRVRFGDILRDFQMALNLNTANVLGFAIPIYFSWFVALVVFFMSRNSSSRICIAKGYL